MRVFKVIFERGGSTVLKAASGRAAKLLAASKYPECGPVSTAICCTLLVGQFRTHVDPALATGEHLLLPAK